MLSALWPQHRARWQYQPGPHDPNPPINLEAAAGLTTNTVGITSTASPSFKLAGVGGAGIGSAWTLAFGWSAASGSTRLIGGREGDGSEAIAVLVNANELQVYGFGASGSVGRYVTYAMGPTQAFWVVRFRYPGTSVANGDIEVYKDSTLQTPVVNDNYGGCDANPRDFDLFVDAGGFTDNALAIYQFSLTAGWQDPAAYFDGTKPYSFASMPGSRLIALGDGMTVAEWNSGTNLGSLGALTRTGTPDLVAGTPATVTLAEVGGGSVSLSLAASEPQDTASATITAAHTLSLAATEPTDIAAISASIGNDISLSLAATEPQDTASLSISANHTLALAATEALDAAAVTLTARHTLALTATEPTDTASVTIAAAHQATLGATEPTDTAAISVNVGSAASLTISATEPQDTASATITARHTLSLVVTEPQDSAAFAASILASGALAATETTDLAAFSVTARHTLVMSLGEPPDIALVIVSGASAPPISGSLVGNPRGGAVLNGRRRGRVLNAPQAGNVYGGRS